MLWNVVMGVVVGAVVGPVVVIAVQRCKVRRLAGRGRLGCGLRVVSGDIEGLARRWRHGAVELDAAVIRCRRGLPGGVSGARPGASLLSLPVEGVQGRRRPRVGEWWSVSPACVVLSIRSQGATVEWAVLASQEAWARNQLQA